MNCIRSIYDHSMVMHMKFCQDILGNRGVIVLYFQNVYDFFSPQS